MSSFEQQNQTIRQFLLGQLSEEQAEQVEDRIFNELEFAEEVQIVEDELIAARHTGQLSGDEYKKFDSRYASRANRLEVEYEKALHEFVALKSPGIAQKVVMPVELHPSFFQRVQAFVFNFRQPLVYGALTVVVLGVLTSTWILLPRLWSQPVVSEDRAKIEAELMALNSSGASPGDIFSTTDLQIAHRASGTMARIAPLNTSADKVLEFNLVLSEKSTKPYRVVVFDDKRNELFVISNPMQKDGADGPRLRVLIPVKYLKAGDYQLDLSVVNENGGYDVVNGYTFRIVR